MSQWVFRFENFQTDSILNAYYSENSLFMKRVPCAIRPLNSFECEAFFSYMYNMVSIDNRQEERGTSNPEKAGEKKRELPVFSKGWTRPVDTMDEA